MEIHYTLKHGSWLNMAEIERSVLSEQCLGREVGAWEQERNGRGSKIDWRFTTDDARIKLKHFYPSFDD